MDRHGAPGAVSTLQILAGLGFVAGQSLKAFASARQSIIAHNDAVAFWKAACFCLIDVCIMIRIIRGFLRRVYIIVVGIKSSKPSYVL